MATRLRAAGKMNWPQYSNWKQKWDDYVAQLPPRSGGFATQAEKAITRNGRPFVRLVLEALASNRINSVDAARHLDLKFEHFDDLRKEMVFGSSRGGGGEEE
jgi:hypothetical protein